MESMGITICSGKNLPFMEINALFCLREEGTEMCG